MFDTHMHLPEDEPVDVPNFFQEARDAGVNNFMLAGTKLEDSLQYADLAESEKGVYCCAGMHPHEATKFTPDCLNVFRSLLRRPRTVAIGEIGMDFYYDITAPEVQKIVFVEMLKLANEMHKPIVIHCRNAFEPCYDAVDKYYDFQQPILVHSFTGTAEEQDAWLKLGAYMSFNGMITFKKADNVRQILSRMPKDKIVLETDSPYLAPVPFRGQPNSPKFIPEIAKRMADELAMDVNDLVKMTTENAKRLFQLQ